MFAICDGTRAVALAPAQDFKRVGDGDAGPNTGGMGAYCPLPWLAAGFVDDVMARFVQPTLDELRRRGIDYRGVLYAGLMLTAGGPEARRVQRPLRRPRQPGRARCASPPTSPSSSRRRPPVGSARRPTFADEAAVLVVAAAEGYPGSGAPG